MLYNYQLHEVDQTIAVLPSVVTITAQGRDVDVLGLVQLIQRLREQVHGVVDQRSLRLKFVTFVSFSLLCSQ